MYDFAKIRFFFQITYIIYKLFFNYPSPFKSSKFSSLFLLLQISPATPSSLLSSLVLSNILLIYKSINILNILI